MLKQAVSRLEVDHLAETLSKVLNHGSTQHNLLSRRAMEILLTAVAEDKPINILPKRIKHLDDAKADDVCTYVQCGLQEFFFFDVSFPNHPAEIDALLRAGLLEGRDGLFSLTPKAFEFLELTYAKDNLPQYFAKKVMCLDCYLHFCVYSWYADRRHHHNLHCPECGQKSGRFLVWLQKEVGFIFETVPGAATHYSVE